MSKEEALLFMEEFLVISKNGARRFKGKSMRNDPRYKECLMLINNVSTPLTPGQLYWLIKNNFNEPVICRTCYKKMDLKIEKPYLEPPASYVKKYCSLKCFNKNSEVRLQSSIREKELAPKRLKKRKDTIIKKYGSWENRPGVNNFKKSNDLLKNDSCIRQTRTLKTRVTNIKKYGVDHPIKLFGEARRRRLLADLTCLVTYGVKNPSRKNYNLQNFNSLTGEFISKKFICPNGFYEVDSMCKYINCARDAAFRLIRKFQVPWNYRPGGFNLDKEATLYYLYDPQEDLYKIGITNKDTSSRFGAGFLRDRKVEILMEESYSSGEQALLAEQELLQAFGNYRTTNPTWPEALGGKTEFFNRNILEL